MVTIHLQTFENVKKVYSNTGLFNLNWTPANTNYLGLNVVRTNRKFGLVKQFLSITNL